MAIARFRPLIVLIVAAVMLAGCGTGGDETKLTETDSPLSAFLAPLGGLALDATAEQTQEFYAEQERQRQNLIAACMAEQGFDYFPAGGDVVVISSRDIERPDDRGWVEKYGYGIVNSPWQDAAPTANPGPSEQVDPNSEYVESLTEAEQQAYSRALLGEPRDSEEEWDWRDHGCVGWSLHEVQGANPWEQAENKQIIEAIRTFYVTMPDDPAFTELHADWADCMAEAGHGGFTRQSDAEASIRDLIDEQNPEATPDLVKSADQEVALALVDLGCREQTDYRQRHLKTQFDLENQFIADHSEELDALKARAEQSQQR